MAVPLHLLSKNLIKTWHITEDTPCSIEEVDANSLLTPQRIDLAAKLAYIEARESGVGIDFAKELYVKHIEAFSQGTFTEPGDDQKTSIDAFFSVFDALIDEIRTSGFNDSRSLVPVGANNVILDGAHRTACAIYFRKPLKIIRFQEFSVDFGYEYFQSRRLSKELLGYMANIYTSYTDHPVYCACLWPISDPGMRKQALEIIKKQYGIIFCKEVMLSQTGLRNLMLQVYQHQDWIGTPETHFAGVMGKVNACFAPGISTEVVLFEGGALEDVLAMKDEIRNIFKLDKHAIHISDSNPETKLMAALLLNDNSCHALNYGKPDTFPEFWDVLLQTAEEKQLSDDCSLAYYGIRGGKRLICEGSDRCANDPRMYFVCMGRKLPALHIVKEQLDRHSAEYEAVSCILRRSNTQSDAKRKLEYWKTSFIWNSQKMILRCKQIVAKMADAIGLYEKLHIIHDKIRKK